MVTGGSTTIPPGRTHSRGLTVLGPIACALVSCAAPRAVPCDDVPAGYKLVFAEDFTTGGSFDRFTFSDEEAWGWGVAPNAAGEDAAGGLHTWLALHASSNYSPPFRSPRSFALIKDLVLGDFIIEYEVAQTGIPYGHRDLCFFFGFVDPGHYYYVHLATTPDERAHNIFLVNGAARRPLCPVPETGADWGAPEQWHRVRLTRQGEDGHIRVFFDGRLTHEVRDATLGEGRVGLGSFDDTGRVRELLVWAPEVGD